MINLFLDSAYWGGATRMNGPQKLATNLISSLEQEGVPFAINQEVHKHNFLVQYDYRGYLKHSELTLENCFIGPQIWFFDEHVKQIQENSQFYNKLIVPSQWTKDMPVQKFGFPEDKIETWPVGIELKDFKKELKYDCLLYYKRRSKEELKAATIFLEQSGLTYNVVEYGSYKQEELETLCDQSAFCFLLNGTESQGIAVQEMMARDLPMFVWDVKEWNDQGPVYSVPASSVPYWSEQCGLRFYDAIEMAFAFDEFCSKIYTPRKFVEEQLSFKASVNRLLEIFNAA
jgi:glycosyltransferase involved in cell wall biosynthesis